MTERDFLYLCQSRSIDLATALEINEVWEAFRSGDVYLLVSVLDREFKQQGQHH